MQGPLRLVVGPSGSGKDTLLDAAKTHFADDPNIIFPQRHISRPADAGGEDHFPITDRDFQTLAKSGFFGLSWVAHGFSYGIPASVFQKMDEGATIVVNVSRSVIAQGRAMTDDVKILSITVSQTALAERLRARGRESAEEIQERLARSTAYCITGPEVVEIDNSGSLEEATSAFLRAIA